MKNNVNYNSCIINEYSCNLLMFDLDILLYLLICLLNLIASIGLEETSIQTAAAMEMPVASLNAESVSVSLSHVFRLMWLA